MFRLISNRLPKFQSLMPVYAVIVFMVYTWTIYTFIRYLPYWLNFLNVSEILAIFSYAMANHQFSMNVLDKDLNWVWGYPEKYYTIDPGPVFRDPEVFYPVTGWQVRPTIKMLPFRQ